VYEIIKLVLSRKIRRIFLEINVRFLKKDYIWGGTLKTQRCG
jgi:hypothetical protein